MAQFVKLQAQGLEKIREMNPRLISYNVEMTEVTGGTFWKAYTDAQVDGTEEFPIISDFEDYKVKQAVVVDPIANGDALAFIDSISQDEMGKITVTKKNVGKVSTAGTADQLASLIVTLTGDVTGTQTIENGNNVSIVTDLSETGVIAGAYSSIFTAGTILSIVKEKMENKKAQ